MAAVRPLTKPMSEKPLRETSPYAPALHERRVPKAALPAGQPREWYETHNRRLKAMRLAIALLDSGVYSARRATDRRICGTADRIGVHRPSRTTCRLVRSLLPPAPAGRR